MAPVLALLLLVLAAALCGSCAGRCARCDHGECVRARCVCHPGWEGDGCHHCGGKLRRGSNSEMTDGVGPYPAGTTCSWLVGSRPNVTVRLHLEEFAMECGSSHLYVHDGKGMDAPLVAALTGVLHRNDHHVARSQEIVTHSGFAFVHYTAHSDVNTSAFRISVRVGSCPRDPAGQDCSGHGRCVGPTCFCDDAYRGDACDVPDCPNDCSGQENGACNDQGVCECKQGFTGEDCSQRVSMGRWEARRPSNRGVSPQGSASHGVVLVANTLYLLGGESYGSADLVYTYNVLRNTWKRFKTKQPPAPRYGHTAVMHDNVVYMYGGTLEKGKVSSELWALDLGSKTWENITVVPENCVPAMCGPIELVGHSANVVFDEYMVVFFGYSPQYGIVNSVQEYHFGNRTWKAVDTYYYPMTGSYGHTSSWDALSGLIYVLGGYRHGGARLSNELFSYEPKERTWKMLFPAPIALYLHTSTFVSGGLMVVYGGNARTDSPSSSCYSPVALTYDAACDQWSHLVVRQKPRRTDLARFGHSAFNYSRSLFVFGGYNGRIMSDLIRFTPGSCEDMAAVGDCIDSRLGVKCVWDRKRLLCQSVDNLPDRPDLKARPTPDAAEDESFRYCRHNESAISAVGEELCPKLPDCLSCTSTSLQCAWLDSGKCAYLGAAGEVAATSSEKCVDRERSQCARHHTCLSCLADVGCIWDQLSCRHYNRSVDGSVPSADTCPNPCDSHSSCSNCTEAGCIWCESDRRCVDPQAEVISYPYGQCLMWARDASRCPAPGESWCQGYLTCASCIHDPACGWCDNGPGAGGTGTCIPGGFKSTEADFCRYRLWYFVDCPACQCNGHSNCTYDVCIQPCGDRTHGEHCENCEPWFYGNPLNGGQCAPCNCSADAVDCDPATGECACSTRGVVGGKCDACDLDGGYVEDPDLPGTCFYDLPVNYQFVYNASEGGDEEEEEEEEMVQFNNINFISRPLTEKINMTFKIECLNNATMNVTVRTASGTEKFLVTNHQFSADKPLFERKFRVKEETSKIVAFRVHLQNVRWPAQLRVSFSQGAKWPRGMKYAPVALSFSMFMVASVLSSKYF